MSMTKGLACSAAGGAIGAALWATLSYLTGYEFGIIAWVVGGLVGLGMYYGAGTHRSRLTGIAAAVIALVAVLGGKFAAVSLYVNHMIAQEAAVDIDDDTARDHLCSDIYQHMSADADQAAAFTWPEGIDEDAAAEFGVFPVEVTAAADRRWNRMSEADRDSLKSSLKTTADAERRHAQGFLTGLAFVFSFGLLDLVFIGLALSSAYKFGASAHEPGASVELPSESLADADSSRGALPDSAAPSAGPLSRIPASLADASDTPRPGEPPLIIKRKHAA